MPYIFEAQLWSSAPALPLTRTIATFSAVVADAKEVEDRSAMSAT